MSHRFGREMLDAWALDPAVVYLNHGTVGATPRRVLEAQQAIRDEVERQPAKALFREFTDLRRRCGDHSQSPSYEQFARSLHQRRAELLEAHAGTDVSFQIVFIDGRAVVRAKAVG